ncbi:hypothetical protein V6N11_026869 [Hibiscus sabdariffa]|uniref:Uncharacterized protein n=1 Tax=Hibiscus sabdariffa TaxID=183260 RepID=A0ABR2SXT4_9ROSI
MMHLWKFNYVGGDRQMTALIWYSWLGGSFMFHFSRSANVLKSESIPRLRHGPYRSALKRVLAVVAALPAVLNKSLGRLTYHNRSTGNMSKSLDAVISCSRLSTWFCLFSLAY